MKETKRMTLKEEMPEPPNLTHTALGVFEEGGQYYVAKFAFDPKTGATGEFEKVAAGPGRDFGIERFKILAAEYNLVG